SDKRGGANGARIRLAPQKDWEVNNPKQLQKVLTQMAIIQEQFNSTQTDDKRVSIADLLVLGGNVGIEKAAQNGGQTITIPFQPGRTDATQDQTDVASFAVLEPIADGFRNYSKINFTISEEEMLVDRAQLLTLTASEMTVLVGGLRVLNCNYNLSSLGVFTHQNDVLSNDFFVNLLDLRTTWSATSDKEVEFMGRDRQTGEIKWKGTRVDLIFGSNSELRALAEVYACEDGNEKFIADFSTAWTKVMNADRFDQM
ncbi:MAG: peroxidase family protein, partial [Flavobacterium sp.]